MLVLLVIVELKEVVDEFVIKLVAVVTVVALVVVGEPVVDVEEVDKSVLVVIAEVLLLPNVEFDTTIKVAVVSVVVNVLVLVLDEVKLLVLVKVDVEV